MSLDDLTEDEKDALIREVLETHRANDDADVDDDHREIAEAVANATDLSRADLLEASLELAATIAERTRVADVDTRHAGDGSGADPAAVANALAAGRSVTTNEALDDPLADVDVGTGVIDE